MIGQLQELGLSGSEAKAYLALAKLGLCRVTQIAREAQLQRTEIYRLMRSLVSKGLVLETLDSPRRYRPADFDAAINDVSRKLITKLDTIKHQSRQLVAKLQTHSRTAKQKDEPQVIVIGGTRQIRRNFREMLASAEKDVQIIAGAKAFARSTESDIRCILGNVSSRNLRARAILEVDRGSVKRIKKLASLVEIRHHQGLDSYVYCIDDRCAGVGLASAAEGSHGRSSELFVTHPTWVATMRRFFDALWNQASPLASRVAVLDGSRHSPQQTNLIWGREQIHA